MSLPSNGRGHWAKGHTVKIIAKAKDFSSLALTTTLLPVPPTFLETLDRVLLGFRGLGLRECYLCLRGGDAGEGSVFSGSLQVSFPSSKEGSSFDRGSPLLMWDDPKKGSHGEAYPQFHNPETPGRLLIRHLDMT